MCGCGINYVGCALGDLGSSGDSDLCHSGMEAFQEETSPPLSTQGIVSQSVSQSVIHCVMAALGEEVVCSFIVSYHLSTIAGVVL